MSIVLLFIAWVTGFATFSIILKGNKVEEEDDLIRPGDVPSLMIVEDLTKDLNIF